MSERTKALLELLAFAVALAAGIALVVLLAIAIGVLWKVVESIALLGGAAAALVAGAM